ncbi:MAG: polysaccharide deacetylase family protein, partial [Rickettsiales bacterium]|nr:polysaccharide deacetylase family protein [Rickettsiales bacterium]
MAGLKGWLTTIFLLLCSTTVSCSGCNFNLPYRGLSCNLDLSYRSLSDIKKLLNNSDKFVALTFDDGPSNNRVNDIINVLESYKAKA